MDQETQGDWEHSRGAPTSWVGQVVFRGGVENLESHVGLRLGKDVLDKGVACAERASHVGEGLAWEGNSAVGLDPARWETGVLGRGGWGGEQGWVTDKELGTWRAPVGQA